MERNDLITMTNDQVVDGLKSHLQAEHEHLARFLILLGEADERRLHLRLGASDLFRYLVDRLGLCESSASKRIAAARAIRRFPQIEALIAEGHLHLTGLYLVSRFLTVENVDELLALVAGQTRREIERRLAARFPQPDLRPIFTRGNSNVDQGLSQSTASTTSSTSPDASSPKPTHPVPQVQPASKARPLSAASVRLSVTIDAETYEIIERLRSLSPKKDVATVLCEAVRLLQEKKDPMKKAERSERRKTKKATGQDKEATSQKAQTVGETLSPTRYIPQAIKDAVYRRDEGRCTFVASDGTRCDARGALEFDHIQPVALGGVSTAENLCLKCKGHNRLAAEDTFGADFIASKIAARQT